MAALAQVQLRRPVVGVHTLQYNAWEAAVAMHRRSTQLPLSEHLLASELLLKRVDLRQLPCHIITLTREPIARAFSFVFEDWRKKIPELRSAAVPACLAMVQQAMDELLASESRHADLSRWFDEELRATFDVDVFSRPYDHERGYTIFPNAKHPLLLMRMEDLNRSLGAALQEFLGITVPPAESRPANRGDDKWYAEKYAASKCALQIAPDTLQRITTTRYFEHFYADRRDEVRARWSRTAAGISSGVR